ncbi:protein-associating with the carboxyl-terminal domain of ezrin [Episyrphus balteatus]|uniref:protein-associating with the carboxyl-terminal domain of ezrin n=1 Tax=Episyrphus balteatus TaxID=286459 RepID=UPI00248509A4|nr:protein-associating with the carboxyl-terminal domain of ezrin [Episyrphus balteatus]
MGNDTSKLKGLVIDKNAIEANDFWTLYNAEVPQDSDSLRMVSIFQGEPVVNGQVWISQGPMERAVKNLMIYRHPYILRYITSWEQGSHKHLATECVRPLSIALPTLTDIQVCLGLRNVLCSLIFLVEQAQARHLNIAISSIYINSEGSWRLGGFEYVWKSKEVTKTLLDLANAYRYKGAIDENEAKTSGDCIEQYAFAVLCEEILKQCSSPDTPYVADFREYCATHLRHQNVAMRPKLSAVLLHPYFNHEFVLIHSFLIELPLKNPQEKQDFFTGLIDRLRYFDENVVGSQIGSLLLSRMVLLDTTAQLCVTPYVLKTKSELSAALFTNATYIKYIIPRIKEIFCVRDAQIRLILLEYFGEYVKLLSREELQDQILPNLLLGIKDTNDILVAKTLRCLADLVPLLGSDVVIGGNRARLFADGRPQALPDSTSHWVEPRSITPVMGGGEFMVSGSPLPDNVDVSGSYNSIGEVNGVVMPQRLSPDGGEDVHNGTDGEIDEDAWSDWENEDRQEVAPPIAIESLIIEPQPPVTSPPSVVQSPRISLSDSFKTSSSNSVVATPKIIDDISELDIKVQKLPGSGNEDIDFFKDMEPVIQKSTTTIIPEALLSSTITDEKLPSSKKSNTVLVVEDVKVDSSRFEFKAPELEETTAEAGWGDDDIDDWGQ